MYNLLLLEYNYCQKINFPYLSAFNSKYFYPSKIHIGD